MRILEPATAKSSAAFNLEQMFRHELEHRDSSTLAACIIEPILQGANGMRMIDPLFQRVLVEACR